MTGKSITVYITVTSEDGKEKQYKLIVNSLPDNVKLLSVKVNAKEANAVPTNKYEARINKLDTSFELYVIPEDPKAKIQINDNKEATGTTSGIITKKSEEEIVTIKVTAQDGTEEIYTLVVSNESDDASLATLIVNGNVISKNEEDGKYYYTAEKFVTESINVKAIASNSLSTVSINRLEETYDKNIDIIQNATTLNIEVIAQDGTQQNYTLILERYSEDNTLKEIQVKGIEEENINKIDEEN